MIKEAILSHPHLYSFFQKLIKGKNDPLVSYLKIQEGAKILDIGCGPGDVLERLPLSCEYHGFDVSEAYIKKAAEKFAKRNAQFHCHSVKESSLNDSEAGTFDVVLSLGVIHHLDDDEAVSLLRMAARALKKKGTFLSADACFINNQSFCAKWLAKMDRGEHVRHYDQYKILAEGVFGASIELFIHNGSLRLPYDLLIMRYVSE